MISIVRRSYQPGSLHLRRILRGRGLNVSVSLLQADEKPERVEICVERRSDGWKKCYPLSPDGDGSTYIAEVPFDAAGLFRYKARYYLEDGTCIPDQTPYAYIMVDPPHLCDLKIYTFIPRINGKIVDGWIPKISQIRSLGFNTIHLLPITPAGYSNSPYAARELFDIDPRYCHGTLPEERFEELERFVSALKSEGMRLCVDLVLNHVSVDSNMANEHPEWLAEDPTEQDGIKRAGWHDGTKWHAWRDLAFINYKTFNEQQRSELWDYMTEYACKWASYAAETGGVIRLDNLHSSLPDFTRHVLAQINKRFPDLTVLAELFSSKEEITHLAFEYGINLLLATPWEHKFVPELRRYLWHLHFENPSLRFFHPATSHDSGSPAEEFGDASSTVPRLVAAMLLGGGPTGMVQGVELGVERKVQFIGPVVEESLQGKADYRAIVAKLTSLRQDMPVLCCMGNIQFIDRDHQAILAAIRTDADSNEPTFLVAANFDTQYSQRFELDEPLRQRLLGETAVNEIDRKPLRECVSGSFLNIPPAGAVAVRITPQST